MGDILIELNKKNDLSVNEEVEISVSSELEDIINYKFIEGYDGVWNSIQDYSEKQKCIWTPKSVGRYMIMVLGETKDSSKPYSERINVVVNDKVRLIKDVEFKKNKLYIGDKMNITVISDEDLLLYRFWIKGEIDWELLRDYGTDNVFNFTANTIGEKEILIECKKVDSANNVDDFTVIKLDVKNIADIEITDFKTLSPNMIVGEELVFTVSANYDTKRPLLYKFSKILSNGKIVCVQEFSSKKTVAFKETKSGDYKLLCHVRDMLSNKEYDDRAMILYNVKPYETVKIKKFDTDMSSPQRANIQINLNTRVVGGRELLYRYIIEGPIADDSGYIRSSSYLWTPHEEGEYTITLKVKDMSYKGDYEDITKIPYTINARGERPVRITDLKCDAGKYVLKNKQVNIKCKASGGSRILYEFRVFKDGKLKQTFKYDECNWINFIPDECGEYEIEVKAKDFYSSKQYDSSISTVINVQDFIPAEIKYVLSNSKEIYLVNDTIDIEAIMENTSNSLVRFVTSINGQEVEDTGYVKSKILRLKPRCSGKYNVNIFAKNVKSTKEYDSRESFSVYIQDVMPVSGTKVLISSDEIKVGKDITFEVESQGGKDICYEFYMMNKGNWILIQEYSKKKYYSFIPFVSGRYKILVLSKSFYKRVNYEDYDIIEFNVEE
ncbi:MAG: triple tyrosine motif-containing protein [Clostridium sp.]|nr:triple tyrosine motif-containing protein [Clostridium sp.]